MARSAARKVVSTAAPSGGARSATFNSPDMSLHGYWLKEKQPIRVEVPIFQHAFYPKLTHTDLDVRQNIMYRQVVVPSMSTLREHGIDVERAVFVAEVVVHPRYIKHNNYFRTDFPAVVKTLARREGTVFIFPANDMPSARLKRKQVLNFWRMAFTPLFVKGSHYTSGRMSMFMTAPPGATRRLSSAMHFEDEKTTKETLTEISSWVGRKPAPRKRTKRPYNTREQYIASQIVSETSERMKDQLLPIVTSKLDIDPHSPTGKELEEFLGAPATSRSLLKTTKSGTRPQAIRTWMRTVFMPGVKRIAAEELADAGESALRFAFQVTTTVLLAAILGHAKASKLGKRIGPLQKTKFSQEVSVPTAGGRFSYGGDGSEHSHATRYQALVSFIADAWASETHEGHVAVEQFLDIKLAKDTEHGVPVTIRLDKNKLARAQRTTPEALGSKMATLDGRDFSQLRQVMEIIRRIAQKANTHVRQGGLDKNEFTADFGGMF